MSAYLNYIIIYIRKSSFSYIFVVDLEICYTAVNNDN